MIFVYYQPACFNNVAYKPRYFVYEYQFEPIKSRSLTLKWPRGVPRDPRFVFRAFYYFRLRFFRRYFF